MQIKNIILAFALTLITADARPTHYDQTTDNSGAPLPNGNSGSDGQNAGHNYGLYNYNNPRQNPDHNGDKVDDCDNEGVDSIGKVPSQKPTPPTSPDHRQDGGYGDNGQPPNDSDDSMGKGPNKKPITPTSPYPGHGGEYRGNNVLPNNPPKDVGNGGNGQPPNGSVDSMGKVPSQKPTPPTSPDHHNNGGYGDNYVPPINPPKDVGNGGNGQPPNDRDDSMGKGPNKKPITPTSQYPGHGGEYRGNNVLPINPPKDVGNGGNGQPPNDSVDSMGKGPNKKPSPPSSQYPGHGGDNHSKIGSGLDDDCESTETLPPYTTPGGNSDPSKPLPGHNFTDPSNKPPTTTQGY